MPEPSVSSIAIYQLRVAVRAPGSLVPGEFARKDSQPSETRTFFASAPR
jgi:hypothetical protein